VETKEVLEQAKGAYERAEEAHRLAGEALRQAKDVYDKAWRIHYGIEIGNVVQFSAKSVNYCDWYTVKRIGVNCYRVWRQRSGEEEAHKTETDDVGIRRLWGEATSEIEEV